VVGPQPAYPAGRARHAAARARPRPGLYRRPAFPWRDQWNGIIRGTSNCLWLYGMAEYGYAADPETRGIIRDAVAAGCSVRVLLFDPEYGATRDIEVDEGNPAGALAARIGVALDLFAKMRTTYLRCRSASTSGIRACRWCAATAG
jgi:hypothetical protein